MSDQDVFKTDDKSGDVTKQADDVVTLLVGEGKKYKTVEELAKAYMHIDEFAETLKAENHELKEKVTKASTVEEVLERLSKPAHAPVSDPSTAAPPSVSADVIRKMVEDTVTGLETNKTRGDNLKKANTLMKDAFGEKAAEVFKEVANTPELERVYKELAQVDPDRFISVFVNVPKNTTAQPDTNGVSTVMTNGAGNRINQVGTKEYYDNIRRTNKALYYSQEFQIGMDKAVRSNPDLYYGKQS